MLWYITHDFEVCKSLPYDITNNIYLLKKLFVCLFCSFVCHVEISHLMVPLVVLIAPLGSSQ
jgi:hypothetical protein